MQFMPKVRCAFFDGFRLSRHRLVLQSFLHFRTNSAMVNVSQLDSLSLFSPAISGNIVLYLQCGLLNQSPKKMIKGACLKTALIFLALFLLVGVCENCRWPERFYFSVNKFIGRVQNVMCMILRVCLTSGMVWNFSCFGTDFSSHSNDAYEHRLRKVIYLCCMMEKLVILLLQLWCVEHHVLLFWHVQFALQTATRLRLKGVLWNVLWRPCDSPLNRWFDLGDLFGIFRGGRSIDEGRW